MANPDSHHGVSDIGHTIMNIVVWIMVMTTAILTVEAIFAGIPFWLPIAGLLIILLCWSFLWWLWDQIFKGNG